MAIVGLDLVGVEAGEVAEGAMLLGLVANVLHVVARAGVGLVGRGAEGVHLLLRLRLRVLLYRARVDALPHVLAHSALVSITFIIIILYFQTSFTH